jgi:hypothetical protein
MLSFAQNLEWAKKANEYVQGKMDIGKSNSIVNDHLKLFAPSLCVRFVRSAVKTTDPGKQLTMLGTRAEHMGCGNCGEQSAMAFLFLKDRGIRPLDWMEATNFDHAFVVVGRAEGSKDTDIKTWGPAAVVCDPWWGEVFAPYEAPRKMHHALVQFRSAY